ncbi:MAG: DUF4843 domain-containing protein [Odoribacteraceae bacterium]|jgi:hypothetical protein|nr:DUF4843 domain-containing protein [Odoribacteraceae bacterium]
MKHMIHLAAIIPALLFLTSCQQNEAMEFAGNGSIYFFEQVPSGFGTMLNASEKNLSFAVLDDAVTETEGRINVRLLGSIIDRDRVFRARVVPDSTTAIEGTHYRLHDGVLPAGALDSYLPVTLFRAPDLKNESVKIFFEMLPTDDLGIGLQEGAFFTLYLGDFFMKPESWTVFVDQYLGAYCDNKYKFIIETLGITDFPMIRGNEPPREGYYTPPQMQGFNYTLINAYAEYRKTNPPIWVDDNAEQKIEIKFQI